MSLCLPQVDRAVCIATHESILAEQDICGLEISLRVSSLINHHIGVNPFQYPLLVLS